MACFGAVRRISAACDSVLHTLVMTWPMPVGIAVWFAMMGPEVITLFCLSLTADATTFLALVQLHMGMSVYMT